MAVADLTECGLLFLAHAHAFFTAGMKGASGRQLGRRRHIALEDDALTLAIYVRIRNC